MPNTDTIQTDKMFPVTANTALILCGPEDIDPITCPELVPDGWRHLLWEDGQPEVIDFEIAGEWFEAYIITKENA